MSGSLIGQGPSNLPFRRSIGGLELPLVILSEAKDLLPARREGSPWTPWRIRRGHSGVIA